MKFASVILDNENDNNNDNKTSNKEYARFI